MTFFEIMYLFHISYKEENIYIRVYSYFEKLNRGGEKIVHDEEKYIKITQKLKHDFHITIICIFLF